MAKSKTVYVCGDCGSESAKWQGQCGDCKAWNTMTRLSIEDTARSARKQGFAGQLAAASILGEVSAQDVPRLATGSGEFDRVLGGGLVPGSAVLISGSPALARVRC